MSRSAEEDEIAQSGQKKHQTKLENTINAESWTIHSQNRHRWGSENAVPVKSKFTDDGSSSLRNSLENTNRGNRSSEFAEQKFGWQRPSFNKEKIKGGFRGGQRGSGF